MHRQAEWPAREVLRLEGFSDAVFAFALTLLVVSLEVPRTFDELLHTLRAAPAFAVCFAIFWLIWNSHHRFFRRYALVDNTILALNAVLLFVVLLYVYPLKFLFTMLLGGATEPGVIRDEGQVRILMVIYSAGWTAVMAIFALMHLHVYQRRDQLRLNPPQVFETRAHLGSQLLYAGIGVLSLIVALAVPPRTAGLAGWVYFLVGPTQWLYWARLAKKRTPLKLKTQS